MIKEGGREEMAKGRWWNVVVYMHFVGGGLTWSGGHRERACRSVAPLFFR